MCIGVNICILRPLFGMLRVDRAVLALKALNGAFVRFAAGGSAGCGGVPISFPC